MGELIPFPVVKARAQAGAVRDPREARLPRNLLRESMESVPEQARDEAELLACWRKLSPESQGYVLGVAAARIQAELSETPRA